MHTFRVWETLHPDRRLHGNGSDFLLPAVVAQKKNVKLHAEPYNQDCISLGSLLGSAYLGKLPCGGIAILQEFSVWFD